MLMKVRVSHTQPIVKTGQICRSQGRIFGEFLLFVLLGKVHKYHEIRKKDLTSVLKMEEFHKRAFISVLS